MYAIVEFLATKEVAVVPLSWVNKNNSKWAPYKTPARLNKAVQNDEEPKEGWDDFNIKVIAKFGE